MDIKEYIKMFNRPYDQVIIDFSEEFKSLWNDEREWYKNIEDKTYLIKDNSDKSEIDSVIINLKTPGFTFSESDTSALSTYIRNINRLVRTANRINNFKEGTELDNGKRLILHELFNKIKETDRFGDLDIQLNSNLDGFLSHLFSVIKHCQNPLLYPIYFRLWKNIIREVLGKADDYDNVCEFYRTFPEVDRHQCFAIYLSTLGVVIAKNIGQYDLNIHKDSKDYKYLINDVINIDFIQSILDKNISDSPEKMGDKTWSELLNVVTKINDEKAVRKFFKSVHNVLTELGLTNKDQIVYASSIKNYLQLTIGGRYVVNIQRKYDSVLLGFYIKNDFLDSLRSKYNKLIISQEPNDINSNRSWVQINPIDLKVEDFTHPILSLAIESSEGKNTSQYRSMYSEKHNPWIIEAALDESVLNRLFQSAINNPKNNKMTFPLNIILYGPPGTGKTFNSIDKAVEISANEKFIFGDHAANKMIYDDLRKSGQIEFVTFHQNYSYEDFVVGISPDVTSGALRFDKRDGIFKQLTERAKQNWLAASKKKEQVIDFNTIFNSFFAKLIEEEVPEVVIQMKSKRFKVTSIDIDEGRIKFTKQSGGTGHDLLVRNLKGIYEGTLDYGKEGLGIYYYPLVEKLREFAKDNKPQKQEDEQLKNYVLVIDEINRANISKVFGELITLLEDDKRLGADNELKVTLPNGEKEFGIPPNLYVIGTMNTADKSIALIDIALRRRFEFIGYYPKYEGYNQEACDFLKTVNANIFDKKKSADYLIGHAYFMKDVPIEIVLKNKVLPLLMEYFSGKTDIVTEIFNGTLWNISYDSTSYSWTVKKK